MPSQSEDQISSSLQASLSNNSEKYEYDSSVPHAYLNRQVILSKIKYVEFSYDSSSFLNDLKSKYIVLSEKDELNESKSNDSADSLSNSNNCNNKTSALSSNSNDRLKAVKRLSTSNVDSSHGVEPSLPIPNRTLWPPDVVPLDWKPSTPVGGGFINLLNSCYLNSTLQALFHIPVFANWLLMDHSHKCSYKPNGPECLICAMSQTLKNSQENTGRAIKPHLIYSKLKAICKHFNPGTQEDAHEFLRHLLDSLDRTYLTSFRDLRLDHLSKETTPLSQIFGGYFRNEVVCLECNYTSTTFQYFQDLPLDIASSSHLEGSLDSFFSKESVSEHEGYKCDNCKRKVPFTKKFSLEKAPKVLCIQLKRFGVSSGKNNKSITLATKLNLNRYKAVRSGDNFEPYHFAAVVNHIGSSTSCGHYTALARAADGKFYQFDDERVERVNGLVQNSSQAYILLYHQKPSVHNNNKSELYSKLILSNSHKNSIQPSSQPSAKERIFGKDSSLVKSLPKQINNGVLTKVKSSISNSLSAVLTKVNGSTSSSGRSDSVYNKHADSQKVETNSKADSQPSTAKSDASSKTCLESEERSSLSGSNRTKCLLVPYVVQLDSSSEEGSCKDEVSRPQTPEPSPAPNCESNAVKSPPPSTSDTDVGPSLPKKSRFDDTWNSLEYHRVNHNDSANKNGVSPSKLSNGHLSTGKPKFSNGNSNSIGHNSGNWMVTDRSASNSPDKLETSTSNWKIKGSSDEGGKDFKSQLMMMSHRGYGKPVSSWLGEKSEIDKEISRENYMNQRMSSYNDNYDMPNKKRKYRHIGNNHHSSYNKNRFNEEQKRKNWFNNGNGYQRTYPGKRQRGSGERYYSKYSYRWDHHS